MKALLLPSHALVLAALATLLPTGCALAAPSREIRDIRRAIPPPAIPPFPLTTLALVAGGVALAWSRVPKKFSRNVPHLVTGAGSVPHLQEEIEAEYRDGRLTPDLLVLGLGSLFRSHLGLVGKLAASRLSSDELLREVARLDLLSSAHLELAGCIFELCDRVKFAGHQPDGTEAEWLIAASRELLCTAGEGTDALS